MPAFFSPGSVEQVRAASDIVEVIGSYVALKRAGANFVGLCPFHHEKTPSFNVNPNRQIYYCFGCHKGGDVFSFLRSIDNLDFPEAVRRLAERAHITLEQDSSPGQKEARQHKDRLIDLHEQVTQRWQAALDGEPSGEVAREYLQRRGVSADAIKLFRLGAASPAWDDIVQWGRAKGFDPKLLESAGLIIRKEETDRHYDRFRGRLMFPICDEQGRVIGFSGRVLQGDEKTAKYVNSPETLIFTKSKVFFGLDKSKRALLDADSAVVCEGQLDLIACFMAGTKNVVAPQGTAFTADHARIIKRFVKEVVLCFDADNAGQNAAVRSLDHLLASGLAVRVAAIPAPHDPDSFIKAMGGEAFAEIIRSAPDFFDFYLGRLCSLHPVATDRGRLAVLREMSVAVHKTANTVLIDKYAQKTAMRLGVAADAVRKEFAKMADAQPSGPVWEDDASMEGNSEPAVPLERPGQQEFWLLKLILGDDDLVPWSARYLALEWVQNALVRQILARRFAAHEAGTWVSLASFVADLPGRVEQSLATEAASDPRPVPETARQIADFARTLRNQALDREMASLAARLGDPAASEAERIALLRQQASLRAAKRAPIQPPALPPPQAPE